MQDEQRARDLEEVDLMLKRIASHQKTATAAEASAETQSVSSEIDIEDSAARRLLETQKAKEEDNFE